SLGEILLHAIAIPELGPVPFTISGADAVDIEFGHLPLISPIHIKQASHIGNVTIRKEAVVILMVARAVEKHANNQLIRFHLGLRLVSRSSIGSSQPLGPLVGGT